VAPAPRRHIIVAVLRHTLPSPPVFWPLLASGRLRRGRPHHESVQDGRSNRGLTSRLAEQRTLGRLQRRRARGAAGRLGAGGVHVGREHAGAQELDAVQHSATLAWRAFSYPICSVLLPFSLRPRCGCPPPRGSMQACRWRPPSPHPAPSRRTGRQRRASAARWTAVQHLCLLLKAPCGAARTPTASATACARRTCARRACGFGVRAQPRVCATARTRSSLAFPRG